MFVITVKHYNREDDLASFFILPAVLYLDLLLAFGCFYRLAYTNEEIGKIISNKKLKL